MSLMETSPHIINTSLNNIPDYIMLIHLLHKFTNTFFFPRKESLQCRRRLFPTSEKNFFSFYVIFKTGEVVMRT